MRSISVRNGLGLACLVALATAGSAGAVDELIPGKIHIVKPGILAKMVAKPATTFNLPVGDPTVGGGTLEIFDTVGGGSPPMTTTLAASGWKGLGNPVGSKGWKYKGAGSVSDPCKVGLVKEKVIKFVCKGAGVTLEPPFAGASGIVFTLDTGNPTRYCAEFGGSDVKNQTGLLKRKDALAPGGCPVAGTTTTSTSSTSTSSTSSTSTSSTSSTSTSSTSTSSTSSTSTSSTSSTTSTSSTSTSTAPACCNGAGALRFTNQFVAPGSDCGDIINNVGTLVSNLSCAGLYTGGGGNTVPLPLAVPDLATSITSITTCASHVATLGATTSVQTGSIRTCTSPGCLFGGPLAVPNPSSTPTSVCVLNAVGGALVGTATCDTGATDLSLPLSSVLFLTGDTATDPADTIAGIQPCPICSSSTCVGGPNNGMSCTAHTSTLGGNPSYPTSHDCPPDPMLNIGTLPVAFGLSTGTLTWSGSNATNDTGNTIGVQSRVFAGFCRDTNGTLAFEGTTPATAHQCWENGMAVNAACTEPFETCEQRNNGAFGPAGGSNRTIRAIGNGMSILGGPAGATLVSVFSIAPTFDPTVDAAGDLPGPGAVSLPGTASLCATPSPCP
jgi:hypothetical protein